MTVPEAVLRDQRPTRARLAAAGSDREVVLIPTDLEVEELVRDHADGPRGGG